MKTVSSQDIPGNILELVSVAKCRIIIVASRLEFLHCENIRATISRKIGEGIKIQFYIRRHAPEHRKFLHSCDISLYEVENLHTTLFINDDTAILTPDGDCENDCPFEGVTAFATETEEELQEVLAQISQYEEEALLAKAFSFPAVEGFDYEKDIKITQLQVALLWDIFNSHYAEKTLKLDPGVEYLSSSNLLPFADTRISSRYEIRIPRTAANSYDIATKIRNMKYVLNTRFSTVWNSTDERFYEIHFIPEEFKDIHTLKNDYFRLTDQLRNSQEEEG